MLIRYVMLNETLLIFLEGQKSKIVQRATSKGQNLSGKIPQSLFIDVTTNGAMVHAVLGSTFEWIFNAWEYGRGKRVSNTRTDFEEKLAQWIARKGLSIKPASLRYLINKRGTALHRGADSRFSGKSSGTISDFAKPSIVQGLLKDISNDIMLQIKSGLRD